MRGIKCNGVTRRLALIWAGLALAPVLGMAQSYPNRAITMVVAGAAGGATDTLARNLGERLSKELKQPVIVENLGGASGAIGALKVVHAAPDGYTLLLGTTSEVVVTPDSNKAAGYLPKDFTPIAEVGAVPLTLIARSGLGVETTDQLIALAKQKPGVLSIGTFGNLSLQAYGAAALMGAANIKLLTVPYGSGSFMNDLLAGRLDLGMTTLPAATPFVKSGKIKILAVLSGDRSPLAPNIPSIDETKNVKGVSIVIWAGLFGPSKLPASVVETLNQAVQTALKDKAWHDERIKIGDGPVPPAPAADFAKLVTNEAARYAGLAKALNH